MFCVIHHICPLVCVLYRIVLGLWVQAVCEGAAGACPVGLPIVWLGPQARAQMMMGGRSEQATIQNLYSSEQATIQRYTVWWGVLSRQQYRTYTVWWGVQRRGQRCQERERRVRGFTMLECPPSNPPWQPIIMMAMMVTVIMKMIVIMMLPPTYKPTMTAHQSTFHLLNHILD